MKDTRLFFSLTPDDYLNKGFLSRTVTPEKKSAAFFSAPFDSLETETLWERARLDASIPEGASIKVSWLASDNTIIRTRQGYQNYMDFIQNQDVDDDTKRQTLDLLFRQSVTNAPDFYLNARGRYLFIRIETSGQTELEPRWDRLRLYFSGFSFLQYLPEIYSMDPAGDRFLRRYLGLFQSLWLDIEQNIDELPRLWDPEVSPDHFLFELSSWLSFQNAHIWQDKLRLIMKRIPQLYKIKGTRQSIGEIVDLYTGDLCYIIEPHEAQLMAAMPVADNLYETSPFIFTVLVNEECLPNEKKRLELLALIDDFKPAHTETNLVLLRSRIHLGGHSYLGINSCLTLPGPVRLDGSTALDRAII